MRLTTTRELHLLADGGGFFEGLRWYDGRWYVSDFAGRVVAIDPSGRLEDLLEVEVPSGLGRLPDGSLLAVSMTTRKIWRRSPAGETSVHADLSEHFDHEANDMLVDPQGRAYVGSYGFDLGGGGHPAETELVRVDPDGTIAVAASGLRFPNGMVLTPDGRTLIVAETIAARLTAFTVQPDGSLTDRRVWAQLGPSPDLAPFAAGMFPHLRFSCDGITLDADGCVWGGRRQVPPLRAHRRWRRDPRGDPRAGRPVRLRLHARRRGRTHARDLHRTRLATRAHGGRASLRHLHHPRRRPARRPAIAHVQLEGNQPMATIEQQSSDTAAIAQLHESFEAQRAAFLRDPYPSARGAARARRRGGRRARRQSHASARR